MIRVGVEPTQEAVDQLSVMLEGKLEEVYPQHGPLSHLRRSQSRRPPKEKEKMERPVMIQKEEKVEKMAKVKKKVKPNRVISLRRQRKGATNVNMATVAAEC